MKSGVKVDVKAPRWFTSVQTSHGSAMPGSQGLACKESIIPYSPGFRDLEVGGDRRRRLCSKTVRLRVDDVTAGGLLQIP